MAIQESDIKFYYSVGSDGIHERSLGGTYSTDEITGKNLFTDITQTTLANGIIDYKCIYLKNGNEAESFNDFTISITEYSPSYVEYGFYGVYSLNSSAIITDAKGDGTSVVYTTSTNHGFVVGQPVLVIGIRGSDLSGYNINANIVSVTSNTFTVTSAATGTYITDTANNSGGIASQTAIKFIDEEQTLTISYSSKPTIEENESYFWLQHENQKVQILWKNNISEQTANIQAGLRTLNKLDSLSVESIEDTNTSRSFKIIIPNQRANDTINQAESGVSNPLNLNITGVVIRRGGPATGVTRSDSNTLINPAVEFNNSQTAPSVAFFDATRSITLSRFYPGDYLGMWIKRTVIAGSTPEDGDGFSINIDAKGSTVDVTRSPLCPTCPPAETPAVTPTVTLGPTATPGPTATQTATPGPTATQTATPGPTATPTVTPSATPFGWTPEPTATATSTPTPTATASDYIDGDIVTLIATTSNPDVEGGGASLTIFGQIYCKELIMKFRYSSVSNDTSPMSGGVYIKDNAWPNSGFIQIAQITLPLGYATAGTLFLFTAELCTGAIAPFDAPNLTVDDGYAFQNGPKGYAIYISTTNTDGGSLPPITECD